MPIMEEEVVYNNPPSFTQPMPSKSMSNEEDDMEDMEILDEHEPSHLSENEVWPHL